MHLQEAGDLSYRLLVLLDELAGVRDLLGRQGRGGTEPHASGLRRDPAGASALHDQGPLELGHAGEDGQHHAPGRRRRVGPWLCQRAQVSAGLVDPLRDRQEVGRRSGEAV